MDQCHVTLLSSWMATVASLASSMLKPQLVTLSEERPSRTYVDQVPAKATNWQFQAIDWLTFCFRSPQALKWCTELGITTITVFAFSVENFKRTIDEVNGLMQIAHDKLGELLQHEYVPPIADSGCLIM